MQQISSTCVAATSVAERLRAALHAAPTVLLTGPMGPDGDSLGACMALKRMLEQHGVTVRVAGTASYRYGWMEDIDSLLDDDAVERQRWDAVVVLDGDRHRLTPACDTAFAHATVRGIIDHHASTVDDGYTHFWLDADAGSTCEMLYHAFQRWGVPLDTTLAEYLYTGLIFDTGGFRYSNTTPASHQMAATLLSTGIDPHRICMAVLMDRHPSGLRLAGDVYQRARFTHGGAACVATLSLEQQAAVGMIDGDLEGIVERLVQVHGVEVGALAIEQPGGLVKISLRSRHAVDVSAVARALHPSGGGHTKAAGVRIEGTLHALCAELETLIGMALQGPSSGEPTA